MLSRRDPFREMDELRQLVDRVFEGAMTGPNLAWQPGVNMAMDVTENEDGYVVKASLPGINPDDLDITYNDRTLTIRGETKSDEEKKENTKYHLRERWFGSFSRSITLPSQVKAEDIKASYKDGVLTLTLPKVEEVKPKHISVNTSGKVIEANISSNKK